jgi:hypothetical protein
VRFGTMKKLLILQIDGLSMVALDKALRDKRMPFIQQLLDSGYKRSEIFSGIPSTTPAGQMSIIYGVNSLVIGFKFLMKKIGIVFNPSDTKTLSIVETLAKKLRPDSIARDCTTVFSLYVGGNPQSLSPGATIKMLVKQILFYFKNPLRTLFILLKMFALRVIERSEYVRFADKRFPIEERIFFFRKRLVNELLGNELCYFFTNHAIETGKPVIFADFPGYDDISHYYGPYSQTSLLSLSIIDLYISKLFEKINKLKTSHSVVIVSDHGQTPAVSISAATGKALGTYIREHYPNLKITEDYEGSENGYIRMADLALFDSGGLSLLFDVQNSRNVLKAELEKKYPDLCAFISKIPGVSFIMTNSDKGLMVTKAGISSLLTKVMIKDLVPFTEEHESDHLYFRLTHLFTVAFPADAYIFGDVFMQNGEITATSFENFLGTHGGIGGPQTKSIFISRDITVEPEKLQDLSGLQDAFVDYVYGPKPS